MSTNKPSFQDSILEFQAVKYLLNNPLAASRVDEEAFSIVPMQIIIKVLKKAKTKLSFAAIERAAHGLKDLDSEIVALLPSYKSKVVNAFTLSDATAFDFVMEQLSTLYESRRFIASLKEAAASMRDGKSVTDVKSEMKASLIASTRSKDRKRGDWVEDYDERKEAVAQRAANDEESGDETKAIPTGIRPFDQLVGGLMRPEFGVVAGKPAVGKTRCLLNFGAYAYSKGYNVVFCSGEMPKLDVQLRLDSYFAGVPAHKYRNGELSKEELKRWEKTIQQYKLSQTNYFEIVSFPRMFTAADIETELSQVQDLHNGGVHLLLIDYLNIMSPSHSNKKYASRDWEAQADVVWDIKGLTSDFNGGICTWTANQIKDEAYDQPKLGMDDLKYARAISETAPVVVGLIETPNDILENRIQFQVLKMRNAECPQKMIYLHPNKALMRMHDGTPTKKDLHELEDEVGNPEKRKSKSFRRGNDD